MGKKKKGEMKWASPKTFCFPMCSGNYCLLQEHTSSKLLIVQKRFFSPSLQFHFSLSLCPCVIYGTRLRSELLRPFLAYAS